MLLFADPDILMICIGSPVTNIHFINQWHIQFTMLRYKSFKYVGFSEENLIFPDDDTHVIVSVWNKLPVQHDRFKSIT